jgi:hypothetical protein
MNRRHFQHSARAEHAGGLFWPVIGSTAEGRLCRRLNTQGFMIIVDPLRIKPCDGEVAMGSSAAGEGR